MSSEAGSEGTTPAGAVHALDDGAIVIGDIAEVESVQDRGLKPLKRLAKGLKVSRYQGLVLTTSF